MELAQFLGHLAQFVALGQFVGHMLSLTHKVSPTNGAYHTSWAKILWNPTNYSSKKPDKPRDAMQHEKEEILSIWLMSSNDVNIICML